MSSPTKTLQERYVELDQGWDEIFYWTDEEAYWKEHHRLLQVEAQLLKERWSQHPWHAKKAEKRGESYWLSLARPKSPKRAPVYSS